MLVVIDIGNTNTVIGIYKERQLLGSWRLVSSHDRTADEYWIVVKLLCNDNKLDTGNIRGIVIGSVVPDLTAAFMKMAQKYLSLNPVVVNYQLDLGLKLLVREPKQLGADRLCNIVAANQLYRFPLIVVDLGTATTFDVLDDAGNYIGGAISPGLVTGSQELIRKAAQLHEIELNYPEHIIGKTTQEHLKSGLFVGHIAMIEGLVERIKQECSKWQMKVIATGGYSEEIARHTRVIDVANSNLTLEGLRLIFERNTAE
jgi:type III pantothenate kinase